MTADVPNWMKAKMEKESIKAKPKTKAAAKKPRAIKPPKERKVRPAWTVAIKIYESKAKNPKLRRGVIAHLRYKGMRVFTLTGATAEATLRHKADEWNKAEYTPDTSTKKLYCEMSDADRVMLASKHSPELNFGE